MIADWPCQARTKSLFCIAIFYRLGCRTAAVALCAASLAACMPGTSPKPQTTAAGLEFEVTGKLAVRNAQRGQSMRFRWRQYPQHYVIEVWGPLGQGRVHLHGTADFMTVERGDEIVAAGVPAEVMQAQLGWSLPVQVLSRWIVGEPHPDYMVTQLAKDKRGQVNGFTQAGWQVSLSAIELRQRRSTPGRIVAARQAQKITVAVQSFLEG